MEIIQKVERMRVLVDGWWWRIFTKKAVEIFLVLGVLLKSENRSWGVWNRVEIGTKFSKFQKRLFSFVNSFENKHQSVQLSFNSKIFQLRNRVPFSNMFNILHKTPEKMNQPKKGKGNFL